VRLNGYISASFAVNLYCTAVFMCWPEFAMVLAAILSRGLSSERFLHCLRRQSWTY
jgi:hypothetical protein